MTPLPQTIAILMLVAILPAVPQAPSGMPLDADRLCAEAPEPAQINHDKPHWGVEIPQPRLDYVASIA